MPNDARPLTRAEYDGIDAVNWSSLKVLARSPAHYRHARTVKREDTPALQRGRLVHLAVFEPAVFLSTVAVFDGRRAGKEWEAFKAAHAGSEIVKPDEIEEISAIADAVRREPSAAKHLVSGAAEVAVRWSRTVKLPDGSAHAEVDCKGRLDFVSSDGVLVDLKTTRDASPDGFGREVWRYGYHTQMAWYRDGYESATGKRLRVVLVAVEAAAPHVVAVYRVPDDILDMGREHYEALLGRYAECRRENRWPGYFIGESELALPRYAYPSDDENLDDVGLDFGAEE